MNRSCKLLAATFLAQVTLATGTGWAASGSAVPAPAAEACKMLENVDFATIEDAPTRIMTSDLVPASGDAPAYCHVRGYINPNIGIELRLPITSWNSKFLEVGCGGFCGTTQFIHLCNGPLRKGYACIASDMGHQSTTQDAKWAYNNLQAEIDHAYRAGHLAALAGKAITQYYYKTRPQRSYFLGCSTGGRQAMVEAQRFPWDFDGVIAGAPSVSVTGLHMDLLWENRALTDKAGSPLLSRDDLRLLHEAVVAKCDLNDGVQDGLIGDPRGCRFDPSILLCRRRSEGGCLKEEQVEAVQKVYAGPSTSAGVPIYMPGALPGSELQWLDGLIGPPENPRQAYQFSGDEFRYSALQPNPGPSWKPENFDFDHDYKRLGMMESLSAGTNPDLRRFKAAGGKLIAYMGWADEIGLPMAAVDYYETAEKTMGGRDATQDFFRLFMIPGMSHCTGGEGAFAIDYLGYLEAWVEQGRAPDVMIGSHVKGYEIMGKAFTQLPFPLDPSLPVSFTRPVYPYPLQAKYRGRGDINDASNFAPVNSD